MRKIPARFWDISDYRDPALFNQKGIDRTLTDELVFKSIKLEKGSNKGLELINAAKVFAAGNGVKLKSLKYTDSGQEVKPGDPLDGSSGTEIYLDMLFEDHKIDIKNSAGGVVIPQVGIYTYTTPLDLANKYKFLKAEGMVAQEDSDFPLPISNNSEIGFSKLAIQLKGHIIIKMFYYDEDANPMPVKNYEADFGNELSYTLDQSEIKALTPLTILHNASNIIYQFDWWVDATTHVPLDAGHIDEVDKTKLVYGMGDVIQIGALYNE